MIERINLLQELSTESFGNHNGFLQLTTHVPCGLIPCPGEIGGNPRSFDEVDTPGVSDVLDEWAGQDGYRDDALDLGLDSLLDQNLVPLDPLDFWRLELGISVTSMETCPVYVSRFSFPVI